MSYRFSVFYYILTQWGNGKHKPTKSPSPERTKDLRLGRSPIPIEMRR